MLLRKPIVAAVVLPLLMALVSLFASPPADAATPALGFESDVNQNGQVEVCNPENLQVARVAQMVIDWNDQTRILPGADPQFVLVDIGQWCELRIDNRGGESADFYARVVFASHPDRLDYSKALGNLPVAQRQATFDHEGGHSIGIAHPPRTKYWCGTTVVAEYVVCKNLGTPRRLTPGPEDEEANRFYWDKLGGQTIEDGTEGPYPIENKCWMSVTTDDADGDGVCDHFGPPPGDSVRVQKVEPDVEPVPVPEDVHALSGVS